MHKKPTLWILIFFHRMSFLFCYQELLNSYHLILVGSQTDLHCMLNTGSPLGIGMYHVEMIMALVIAMSLDVLSKNTGCDRGLLVAEICACLV